MKFNIEPRKQPDQQIIQPPENFKNPTSGGIGSNWKIYFSVGIIAIVGVVLIYSWIDYESNKLDIVEQMCPDCTCPDINIPACPTYPTIPDCPTCGDCTITTDGSISLDSINQTCIGFNQIVDMIIYNATDNYTVRMEYHGDYYEITNTSAVANVNKVQIKIGG